MAAEGALSTLFPDLPKKRKDADKLTNMEKSAADVSDGLASHALVFQITSTGRGGRRLQRVVGVHPVRDCTADHLHQLLIETLQHLCVHAGINVAAIVCDGAATNRLCIKMCTTGVGAGAPDDFKQVSV